MEDAVGAWEARAAEAEAIEACCLAPRVAELAKDLWVVATREVGGWGVGQPGVAARAVAVWGVEVWAAVGSVVLMVVPGAAAAGN